MKHREHNYISLESENNFKLTSISGQHIIDLLDNVEERLIAIFIHDLSLIIRNTSNNNVMIRTIDTFDILNNEI